MKKLSNTTQLKNLLGKIPLKKLFQKIPKKKRMTVLCVLMAVLLVYAIGLRFNASSLGSDIGSGAGSLVGKAVGSFSGMTVGRDKGTEAGKTEALSAENTSVDVAVQIRDLEKLEVLVASVKLSNFHTIGNEDNPNYAALYLASGKVVFTVDLSKAAFSSQEDGLHISMSKPSGALFIDNSTVDKVSDYQKKFFNGSAEDGFDAYLNTMKKLQSDTVESLDNYEALISSARKAAENQITLLAKSVSHLSGSVIIDWID